MPADAFIHCRVAPEIKAALRAAAEREHLNESALIKQLLIGLTRLGSSPEARALVASPPPPRDARLYVRLDPSDRSLLREQAAARGMATATYVAVLLRAQLRNLAPLPREELQALKAAVSQLGAVGRNLNQIARAMNRGGLVSGPDRKEMIEMLEACEGIRRDVKALLRANARAWRQGHGEATV